MEETVETEATPNRPAEQEQNPKTVEVGEGFPSVLLAQMAEEAMKGKGAVDEVLQTFSLPSTDKVIASANMDIAGQMASRNQAEMVRRFEGDPVTRFIAEKIWGITDPTDAVQARAAYEKAISGATSFMTKMTGVEVPAPLKGAANLLVGGTMNVLDQGTKFLQSKLHPRPPMRAVA